MSTILIGSSIGSIAAFLCAVFGFLHGVQMHHRMTKGAFDLATRLSSGGENAIYIQKLAVTKTSIKWRMNDNELFALTIGGKLTVYSAHPRNFRNREFMLGRKFTVTVDIFDDITKATLHAHASNLPRDSAYSDAANELKDNLGFK